MWEILLLLGQIDIYNLINLTDVRTYIEFVQFK